MSVGLFVLFPVFDFVVSGLCGLILRLVGRNELKATEI